MNAKLTDITLVVDRSGSMNQVREDAEGGVNEFIETQASEPGDALLTLIQFDTEHEFLHKGIPADQVPKYKLRPRGMTALLDAVGRAIHETGERLSQMNQSDRPGLVVFVIMTDGHENSSVEFTKTQIRNLIEHQQTKYSWQFTFLGADQDAFAEAGALGIVATGAAAFAKAKVGVAFTGTAAKVSRMRAQCRKGESIRNEFFDDERNQMR